MFIAAHFLLNFSTVFDSSFPDFVEAISSSFRLRTSSVNFSVSDLSVFYLIAFAFIFPLDIDLSVIGFVSI